MTEVPLAWSPHLRSPSRHSGGARMPAGPKGRPAPITEHTPLALTGQGECLSRVGRYPRDGWEKRASGIRQTRDNFPTPPHSRLQLLLVSSIIPTGAETETWRESSSPTSQHIDASTKHGRGITSGTPLQLCGVFSPRKVGSEGMHIPARRCFEVRLAFCNGNENRQCQC